MKNTGKIISGALFFLIFAFLQGKPACAQDTILPLLTWRFANPEILPGDSMAFDIELKCSQAGTYHTSLWVCFNYRPEAFGENIKANGKVSWSNLELMDGSVNGLPKYNIVAVADNQPFRLGMITESFFINALPECHNEVDTVFRGFMQFRIAIADMTECAGIEFSPSVNGINLMPGGWGSHFVKGLKDEGTKNATNAQIKDESEHAFYRIALLVKK
ncbi:MAG: hypothetical protein JW861_00380 [Bacteroidales bacterium]|nr:hypothetical protein [Bacteroidales bacterium]